MQGRFSAILPVMLKDAIDLSGVVRVLVIKLRHHGDVLLTSPVFTTLKAHAPAAQIDALVYSDTRDMLALHPAIAQIHAIDRNWKRLPLFSRLAAEWRLYSALRTRRYDLIIHLSENPRGAALVRLLKPRYAVAPDYAGRSQRWKKSFTHRFAMAKNPRRHMVEWNLDALRRLGVYAAPEQRQLTLVSGAAAEAEVDALFAKHALTAGGFIDFYPVFSPAVKAGGADGTADGNDLGPGGG